MRNTGMFKWKEAFCIRVVTGVVVLSIVSQCQCAPAERDEVIFFEDSQYNGDRLFLTLGSGCYTIDKDWDDRISSVDLQGNCLMAFEKPDCRGRSEKLSEGMPELADLRRIQFDNVLSSISACPKTRGRLSTTASNKQSDKGGLDIWLVGLEEHNRYRRLHGVPPLSGDRQLHDDAQEHADYLARNNRFEVSPGTKYGENLATSYAKDKLDAIREVVKRWYEKIEYYNFRNPEANKDRPKSAQFSSVVWKSTTHMGIGVARNNHDNKWVIVVFYDPAATRTKYKENVLPALKELNMERPSLIRTSAMANLYDYRRDYDAYV